MNEQKLRQLYSGATWGLCDNLDWGETQKVPVTALVKLHQESQ